MMSNIRQYRDLSFYGYTSIYKNTELFNYYNNSVMGFSFSLNLEGCTFNDIYRFNSYEVDIDLRLGINNRIYYL